MGCLFKNSTSLSQRKTGMVYYDCTNFYFEIEQAEDDKQYGASKENRPLPIVETEKLHAGGKGRMTLSGLSERTMQRMTGKLRENR